MADLVPQSFVTSVIRSAAGIDPGILTDLISAASQTVQRYCRRSFIPNRYVELYDRPHTPYLMLRRTPVLALNSVTLFPTWPSPIVIPIDQIDLRPELGRICLKPQVDFPPFAAAFMLENSADLCSATRDVIQVDYTAGFGFLTTAAQVIAAGAGAAVPVAMNGWSQNQPWAIATGSALIIDPGTPNQEALTISAVTNNSFAASFVFPHESVTPIAGIIIPSDVQLAVALIVGNLLNQPDLTKQRESQGKTIGYEYTVRAGDLLLTPEIKTLLNPYRDTVV